MKSIIIFITLAAIGCEGYSQYNKHWTFGDSVGITFEADGSISTFNSKMRAFEAAASVSTGDGDLLFYTNGQQVWNKENEVMENSSGMDIGQLQFFGEEYGSSLTQGVIIIPYPENFNKYYVFYIAYQFFPVEELGLRYAVVDMSLNGGLGEVTEKNISIYDSLTCEKLQAVKHANGRDWWLLARQKPYTLEGINEIQFIRFLITSDGIEGPFYQHFGPDNLWADDNFGFGGEMIFSPQGDKLAYAAGTNLDIYDFDRCSGELSNVKTIYDIDNILTYSCAFSRDGNKVYVSAYQKQDLYQYCLNCKEEVDSTKTLLYHVAGYYDIGQLELGPDYKIYFTTSYGEIPNDVYNVKTMNLCVINSPNELGLACDLDTSVIWLGGKRAFIGLPNMPNYNLGALAGSECDTLSVSIEKIKNQKEISIYPNPSSGFIWLNGYNDKDILHLTFYSSDGKEMLLAPIVNSTYGIDISALPEGFYLVKVTNKNGFSYTHSLIISNGLSK